jgi:hypothetical protein
VSVCVHNGRGRAERRCSRIYGLKAHPRAGKEWVDGWDGRDGGRARGGWMGGLITSFNIYIQKVKKIT